MSERRLILTVEVVVVEQPRPDLWIVERGGLGHLIVERDGPIVAACGKGRHGWRHATVIDREPRKVCEDCRRVLAGEPTRPVVGVDPKRETQGSLFPGGTR
jgi:hypothetical protein